MYVYMYVCDVCMNVCMFECMYVCMYVRTYECVYTYTYTCLCMYLYTYVLYNSSETSEIWWMRCAEMEVSQWASHNPVTTKLFLCLSCVYSLSATRFPFKNLPILSTRITKLKSFWIVNHKLIFTNLLLQKFVIRALVRLCKLRYIAHFQLFCYTVVIIFIFYNYYCFIFSCLGFLLYPFGPGFLLSWFNLFVASLYFRCLSNWPLGCWLGT